MLYVTKFDPFYMGVGLTQFSRTQWHVEGVFGTDSPGFDFALSHAIEWLREHEEAELSSLRTLLCYTICALKFEIRTSSESKAPASAPQSKSRRKSTSKLPRAKQKLSTQQSPSETTTKSPASPNKETSKPVIKQASRASAATPPKNTINEPSCNTALRNLVAAATGQPAENSTVEATHPTAPAQSTAHPSQSPPRSPSKSS